MITPKLIHPIVIYIAKFISGKDSKAWDDEFKTKERKVKLVWDMENPVVLPAQIKTIMNKQIDKVTGGWSISSRQTFLVNASDAIDPVTKKYKFDRGDRIIRYTDNCRTYTQETELYIKDFIMRAPYNRFHFIHLITTDRNVEK